MQHKQLFHRASGQSIVLIGLAILVLVGAAGLGLDGANAFNQRRNTANAADAAAMAGASELIKQQKANGLNSEVYQSVSNYLSEHGIDPASPRNAWAAYYVDSAGVRGAQVADDSSTVPANVRGVAVDVTYAFDTLFMPVLGQNELKVSTTATAIYGPRSFSPADMLPITMSTKGAKAMKDNPGTTYVFGPSSGAYKELPGNFGTVTLKPNEDLPNKVGNNSDCDDASSPLDNLSYWWCNGTSYAIDSGDYLYGDPGIMAMNLDYEVEVRIKKNDGIGIIPVFDKAADSGNNTQYHIVGFLVVQLTDKDLNGNPKTVSAKYIDYYATTGAINPNGPDNGIYAVNLIK